jgi:glutathionylspermidine synthase
MVHTRNIQNLSPEAFYEIGCDWFENLAEDHPEIVAEAQYCAGELVEVTDAEADAIYKATNKLYDMFIEAAEHVIDNNFFTDFGISERMANLIRTTWKEDGDWHLYGRFDLAGGIDGSPIKLIEFNADTATMLFESSVIQWLHLKENGFDDTRQFNSIFECLVENFRKVRELNFVKEPHILFSSLPEFSEDEMTCRLIGMAAKEAGFEIDFEDVDQVTFDKSGIYTTTETLFRTGSQWPFWFKLIPWEWIEKDEPVLFSLLEGLIVSGRAVVLNPPYTLLFQNKMLLKVLWDLFPRHPLLLETSASPLPCKHVKKVIYGREGQNVEIMFGGVTTAKNDGDYADQPSIYQKYVDLPTDGLGRKYQTGSFFAGEAAGIGFRRGGEIINNFSQFLGHILIP